LWGEEFAGQSKANYTCTLGLFKFVIVGWQNHLISNGKWVIHQCFSMQLNLKRWHGNNGVACMSQSFTSNHMECCFFFNIYLRHHLLSHRVGKSPTMEAMKFFFVCIWANEAMSSTTPMHTRIISNVKKIKIMIMPLSKTPFLKYSTWLDTWQLEINEGKDLSNPLEFQRSLWKSNLSSLQPIND